MFYQRYKSAPMSAIVRKSGGLLLGRTIEVEVDFGCELLDERGLLLPDHELAVIDERMCSMFDGKLMIDNQDPHADELMKLKRIKAADPVLFDHGTSGPQLAFYVGRWVEDYIKSARFNPPEDDPAHVKVILCTVRVGKSEFFYDLA